MGKTIKLQQHGEDGTFKLTVPKSVAEAKDWEKGDEFDMTDLGNEIRYVHQ